MLIEPRCVRHVSLDRVCRPTLRFPPQGPPGRVPLLQRYYQSVTTSCRPSRRTSFPSLGGTSAFTRSFRSPADECAAEAWSWSPGISSRDSPRSEQGSPKFLGNLGCPFAMFQSDSGGTACVRPLRHSSVAPGMQKAKAPTKGLSELNSMAFGLAVYASQCELPQHHARLASSCWSGSTARDFHPQGSYERFQSCNLHLIPLSQALLGAIASTAAGLCRCQLAAVKFTAGSSGQPGV
mgnify:CR=1 FL=1